jgi:2-iminobutanoate/2-iminopropanoate deaminase
MSATAQAINSDGAPAPTGPFSHAVVRDGVVYVGGQGPFGVDGNRIEGDFETQVRATLANIEAVLASAGSSLARVVKVNIFISDLKYLGDLNRVYAEVFAEPFPVRTTVQVGLPGFDVEIEVVAGLDG